MFNVTIKNVPDSKLGELVAQIGTKKYSVRVAHVPHRDQTELKKLGSPAKRMDSNTILTMTGKSAAKGSQRASIMTAFEKLEKKHGIGKVSRVMLRREVARLKFDPTVVGQLIKDGYLRPLNGE